MSEHCQDKVRMTRNMIDVQVTYLSATTLKDAIELRYVKIDSPQVTTAV